MSHGRAVKVECQCGRLLFKYYKGGRGRLIKCFLELISHDQVGLENLPLEARPSCPECGKELGMIRMVSGRPALKLNQGAIRNLRL